MFDPASSSNSNTSQKNDNGKMVVEVVTITYVFTSTGTFPCSTLMQIKHIVHAGIIDTNNKSF